MQYLIVEKSTDGTNRVVLGPMDWRPSFFKNILLDDLDISFDVPSSNDKEEVIVVTEDVKIIPVKDSPKSFEYNPKIHNLAGPFYDYFDTHAESYWVPQEKSIEQLKLELRSQISSKRYEYETRGIVLEIQGKSIPISTTRENRNQFLHYQLSGLESVNWKVGDEFITLSSSDIQYIVTEISNHIQSSFDWEMEKFNEIELNNSLVDLSNILTKSTNPLWEPNSSI